MNSFIIYTIKILHKAYLKALKKNKKVLPVCDMDPDSVSNTIIDALESPNAIMIARFGANELSSLVNYLGIKQSKRSVINYIKGESHPWWWEQSNLELMQNNAGFFPASENAMNKFGKLMLTDIKEVDILGSWLPNETYFERELAHAQKIRLMYLDPYWSKIPWSKALKGKNILVVHPFAESIRKQYQKRELLFDNQDTLPEFNSLTVIQAVQSIGAGDSRFNDWFEALDYMKKEIEKQNFDICLIGCGAYGFPLAAHVKRIGKKAVHMGGSLQLLFGIRGKRWEQYDPHYVQPGNIFIHYHGLPNRHWIRPAIEEKPKNHNNVENSCYW